MAEKKKVTRSWSSDKNIRQWFFVFNFLGVAVASFSTKRGFARKNDEEQKKIGGNGETQKRKNGNDKCIQKIGGKFPAQIGTI